MSDLIRYEVRRGVATITLDSPDNRNALSTTLAQAVLGGVRAAEGLGLGGQVDPHDHHQAAEEGQQEALTSVSVRKC